MLSNYPKAAWGKLAKLAAMILEAAVWMVRVLRLTASVLRFLYSF